LKKKPINYISNRHLYGVLIHYKNEIIEAKEKNLPLPSIPRDVGMAIDLICTNLLKKSNFSGYSPQYKEEMKGDAQLDCVQAVDNFDPDRTNNPFAYFTQIAWNAFIRRIQKEKKQQYIKQKNYENKFVLGRSPDDDPTTFKFNEITSDAIKSYEDKYVKVGQASVVKKTKLKKGLERFIEEKA
jgi:hypothetical protein